MRGWHFAGGPDAHGSRERAGARDEARDGIQRAPVVHGKGQYPAAEKACLEAVARKTRVHRSKLKITDVSSAQAGVGVTVKVPGVEAPWSCLANRKGRVQGVSYTGDEGRL